MHNIEQFEDGTAAIVTGHREPGWHRLGETVEGAMTAEEAAAKAYLAGWNVRKDEIRTESGLVIPDKRATVRTHPKTGRDDYLGVVGKGYKIVQNEDAFGVLDAIIDEGGANFDTAGSLDKGRRVFMSMRLPDGIKVAGEDYKGWIVAYNSHDGTSAFSVTTGLVRPVCENTMNAHLASAKTKWTLRHTSSVEGKIAEARETLGLTYEYIDAFDAEMSLLLDEEFTKSEFKALAESLMPDSASEHEGWQERTLAQRATLTSLLDSDTTEYGRGTKYAAYNAITEYADWGMPVRGEDPEGVKRAERNMTAASVQTFKNKGLALLKA